MKFWSLLQNMFNRYFKNKEDWYQQYGRIGGPQPMSLHRNKYLAGIHRQKCLCGSTGIQVGGCKALVEPKNEEAGLHTSDRPSNYGPIYEPKAAPSSCGFGSSPPCPVPHLAPSQGTLIGTLSNRPANLRPYCGPQSIPITQLQFHSPAAQT